MKLEHLDPRAAPEPGAYRAPRAETHRLATFPRGETEELRVELAEYEGRPFIGARIWFQGSDGGWHPTRRGISIRLKELEPLVRALSDPALQLVGGRRTGGKGEPRGGTRDMAMEVQDDE